jgi:protein TonB
VIPPRTDLSGDAIPPPLPSRFPVLDRLRNLIWWGAGISLLLHLALAPFAGLYKPSHASEAESSVVSVAHKIKVVVPTPPPPTPTPPPQKSTPPPRSATSAPQPKVQLKLNVPKTTSHSADGPSESTYNAPKSGSENGVPQGDAATGAPGNGAGEAAGTPASPAPIPTPTARPACAVPNAVARMVQPVELEYPESARQQGIVGSVDVVVTLDAAGAVLKTAVFKSAHNSALDLAATNAARASKYAAEIVDCKPTGGSYLFHADFTSQ